MTSPAKLYAKLLEDASIAIGFRDFERLVQAFGEVPDLVELVAGVAVVGGVLAASRVPRARAGDGDPEEAWVASPEVITPAYRSPPIPM